MTITAPATVKYAFYGRVSTEDAQDPSLSIPRQLAACQRAIEAGGGEIVAFFWDIESGRKELAQRGRGADGTPLGVAVPRDGGLADLRSRAGNGCGFDAVIVESIDRLSRMTADATRIERELEQLDIGLFAADEPMVANATAILTRRVKQGVAEWYVRDLIEKSRRGMEESVRQGWHTGGPVLYGFALEPHEHPNPHKAREGKLKHKLVVDPVRGPIVLMVYEDYCVHGIGLGEIVDKLNRDLDRFPPPQRNRKDENALVQTWSRSQLHSMLRNPKYTGFNVWNRHDKRRGRPLVRPREQWIWSPAPTHPAIVSRTLFDAVEERASRNQARSRTPQLNDYAHRAGRRTGRFYVLRGRVNCGLCGRRMEGSHQKGSNWYRCQFARRRGGAAAIAAGHPQVLGIKEDKVLDAVLDFLAERIFGPDRMRLLRAELATAETDSWREHDAELQRLRRERIDVDRSLQRQALRLEEHDDPNHPVIALATRRIEELSARAASIAEAITALEAKRPTAASPDEIAAMLDAIPDMRESLATDDETELAEIFDAFDVTATYDKPNARLELAATVTPELVTTQEKSDRPGGRSRNSVIAGAGFEPATFGL
jgi:site-specific DNA recombinase